MSETRTATFLLAKDPTIDHGGDIALSRLVMRLAAESVSVRGIALSRAADPSPDASIRRIPKPPVSVPKLAATSLLTGRSIVHTRFDVPALRHAIDETATDLFVAEHNYMAESYLRSRHRGSTPIVLNTINSESLVFAATRGRAGRLESRRILRDEVRTAKAMRAVGTYDSDEAQFYRDRGVDPVFWLDITLPPGTRTPVETTGRRLIFLGDRTWPPNHEAFVLLASWWPEIARGIEGAELVVVGKRDPAAPYPAIPDGLKDIGFADDLDEMLGSGRALVAPVQTGGGVRVKLLDSASRGLPVIGTTAAIGAHASVLGVTPFDDKKAFIEQARRYLLDRDAATAEGQRLYEANADRWNAGIPHSRIAEWISA
ncbi:glycosyltransferase involved in cell wall biosynthesis [Microbacteriaceae bacterium SG_E_30_P1]|uniref:Glycosyltransferase involved in cell wall biosynthesis n=1 Tax=Antiquaquibacter oligotrophicus TaxID=2880260 RepID=A0ABT6KNW1_9MICO|nr:glycosyltransferase family 4 protein [Antiquaquibacter oligotrophicus]MDH6181683.1 glycosyltransferase involved in cell wall biosynthesis [Antiquaquibacter oligotrophicus]UDF12633.1 glycosyltransferase family 4 protein [Antiquaquibacter oligotrophicus]